MGNLLAMIMSVHLQVAKAVYRNRQPRADMTRKGIMQTSMSSLNQFVDVAPLHIYFEHVKVCAERV